MRKKHLGRTGLAVTELGYGAGQLRGPRHWGGRAVTDDQAERILNTVLDVGINFIDTANIYGPSEDYIGRFIAHRRSEYFLATKCGCQKIPGIDRDDHRRVWETEFLNASVNASLRRLNTDCVDLLQLHNPTFEDFQAHELARFLDDARHAGKTRFVGISTTLPDLTKFLALGIFDTFQIPYSALEREHEEWINRAAEQGCGTIIRGGVAQGSSAKIAGGLERVRDLIGEMHPLEFVLRFTLSHPGLHTAIVATLIPEHVTENRRVVERGPLPPEIYAEAKRRLTLTPS